MAGRYGGEEFVVLMPSYNQQDAFNFAKRLQEHLASNPLLSHDKEDIYISASMGLAVHNNEDPANKSQYFESADELVKAADQAMYSAKRTGRNRILLYTTQGYEDLSVKD